MEPQIPPDAVQKITELLYAGRKIEAIKIVRDAIDSDLLQAKLAVEAFERDLQQKHPEKFAKRSGCGTASAALLCVIITLGVVIVRWS